MKLYSGNGGDHPARAVDSTQVKTADRGLGVHRLVIASPLLHMRGEDHQNRACPECTNPFLSTRPAIQGAQRSLFRYAKNRPQRIGRILAE
jgi:hypothetical protein